MLKEDITLKRWFVGVPINTPTNQFVRTLCLDFRLEYIEMLWASSNCAWDQHLKEMAAKINANIVSFYPLKFDVIKTIIKFGMNKMSVTRLQMCL